MILFEYIVGTQGVNFVLNLMKDLINEGIDEWRNWLINELIKAEIY
jgi:hypothetical protein